MILLVSISPTSSSTTKIWECLPHHLRAAKEVNNKAAKHNNLKMESCFHPEMLVSMEVPVVPVCKVVSTTKTKVE
jgi:hypothetical protein